MKWLATAALIAGAASLAILEFPMKPNTWQKQYGASRRKIDKAILAAAERAIPDGPPKVGTIATPDWITGELVNQLEFERAKRAALLKHR